MGARALDVWFYLCLGFTLAGLLRALVLVCVHQAAGAAGGATDAGAGTAADRELLSGSQLARSTETAWARAVRRHLGPAVDPDASRRKRRARRCADAAFFAAYASGFAAASLVYWATYLVRAAEARREAKGGA